jgi:hypothetical protein
MANGTFTCDICGATFEQRGRGPRRRCCQECRNRQYADLLASKRKSTEVECLACGVRFVGGKHRKFCGQCPCVEGRCDGLATKGRGLCEVHAGRERQASLVQSRADRICTECGKVIPGHVNGNRKYCSDLCSREVERRSLLASDAYKRAQAKHKQRRREDPEYRAELNRRKRNVARVCEWCGADYLGRKSRAVRFCSIQCHNGYHNSLRSPVASPWSPKWPDVIRRNDGLDALNAAARWKSSQVAVIRRNVPLETMKRAMVYAERDRRVRFVGVSCRGCGEVFLWDYRVGGVAAVWCSTRCSVRPARERRRARKRDAYVEDVYRAQVYRRDRYRCQICNGRLAMKQVVPHPKAPTIDHIIPLAVGGTHEMKNVQAAHFWCNANKNANAANDQLLLFG